MIMSRRYVLIDGATAAAIPVAGSESPEDTRSRTGRIKLSHDITIIIISGDSEGAVLAAGLSADVQRRVLLIEAGQNFKPNSYPSAITDANVVAAPAFDWRYQAYDHVRLGPDIPVPRGRVIGLFHEWWSSARRNWTPHEHPPCKLNKVKPEREEI
jgi:choline dehydrogenase